MRNDPDVQYAVNAFQLSLPRTPITGRSGELLGRGTGSSLEFQEYREYTLGDDIRHLDWAAYGRSDSLMVRLYREEISPHTEILVDASESMTTGNGEKELVTRQLTGLFSMLTGRIGGQVQIHWLDDSPTPLKLNLLQLDEIATLPCSGKMSLSESLARSGLRLGRKAVRIVISDFLFPHDPETLIRQLSADAGQLWIVQLLNRFEADPTPVGGRKLTDVETGAECNLLLDRSRITEYKRRLKHLQEELIRNCQRVHANFVSLIAEQGLRELCRTEICQAGLLSAV
ncbi:MAG: DUF58 domain-containing protein [Planctomycetaceae bacterium]